jgi:hypothetical protein
MTTTTGRATDRLMCPFELTIEPMAKMLNFELEDHRVYEGVEIQRFDDETHGRGMLAFVKRREDGRIDVYRQAGLRLDPGAFEIAGGLGRWEEATIDPDRFEVTPIGIDVDVAFRDHAGRTIEVRMDDRGGGARRPATMLAPLGAAVERPTSMLLAWMRRFDLVRANAAVDIRIDGRPVTTGRLPGTWLHGRRLIKYAADTAVVRLNPARSAEGLPVSGELPTECSEGPVTLAGLSAADAGGGARLDLVPPLPDLRYLRDGDGIEGSWTVGIDDEPVVVGGSWRARRRGGSIELMLDVTRGWRPRGLPALMRIVTGVIPIFRTWPTTYRWWGAISLGDPPAMTSRWERTTDRRAESYRRLTSSGR